MNDENRREQDRRELRDHVVREWTAAIRRGEKIRFNMKFYRPPNNPQK